jgi:copper chaperone CopZ
VRSALLSVKGVVRAQVKLEAYEALVTYDPAVAAIEDMIAAVGEAEHPIQGRGVYKATVKQ